jgi:hypothetical protein
MWLVNNIKELIHNTMYWQKFRTNVPNLHTYRRVWDARVVPRVRDLHRSSPVRISWAARVRCIMQSWVLFTYKWVYMKNTHEVCVKYFWRYIVPEVLSPKARFHIWCVSVAVFPSLKQTLYRRTALSGQPLQNRKVTELTTMEIRSPTINSTPLAILI